MEMRWHDLAHPLQLGRRAPAQTVYGQVIADVQDWQQVFVIFGRSVNRSLMRWKRLRRHYSVFDRTGRVTTHWYRVAVTADAPAVAPPTADS